MIYLETVIMPKLIKNSKQKSMPEKEYPERKSIIYSQNFLKSPELVHHLLENTSINSNDIVYEIGPGKGIITEQLASRCQKVVAIEKDRKLSLRLKHRFSQNPKIEIREGDFLKYKLPSFEYKVFSNIPFNITADIIKKLINTENSPSDTYLILQKEAAKKFNGFPYTDKETLFSLLIKPWFKPEVIHNFRPNDFEPKPNIDTVLFRLEKRKKSLINNQEAQLYRDFITYVFNQWKPNAKESLKKIFTNKQLTKLAKNLDFNKSATVTQIKFDQWLGLFKYFLVGVEPAKKQFIIASTTRLEKQQKKLQKIHRTRTQTDWRRYIHKK